MVACAHTSPKTASDNRPNASEGETIPVYTPPAGGMNYIISAGVSEILNQPDKLADTQFSIETTSGNAEMMVNLVERYDQDKPAIAAPSYDQAYGAYNGTSDFFDEELKKLRAVSYLGGAAIHIVVNADSSIKTIEDLKGKRIGTGIPGDTRYNFLIYFLNEHGIDENEFEPIPLGFSEIQDGLVNGSIDAGIITALPPAAPILELTQSIDVRILSVDADKLENFKSTRPYYTGIQVEAGTYPKQDDDILIVGFKSLFVTHEETSEEVVYEFVKSIIEEEEKLKGVHATYDISEDNIASITDIPFHPGAIKYFEEIGINIE